jgi:zinc protease
LTDPLPNGDLVVDGVFHPQTCRLDNGLDVVLVQNHRAAVVSHWVWYRVGTADSPPGKSGLPHFLEHLMFKGTARIPPGQFSKIVARNGGNDNAFTSYDFTAYFQMIAKDRLPLVMEMEADRMTNLRLDDATVYPERDVIVEERRQRIDNDPNSLFFEQLSALQHLHHPYRLPVIGWMHEIESYRREDAEAFYRQWYAPNNAALVVVGDVTMDELRPLAEQYYGGIPARALPERWRPAEPPQHAERRVVLADPRVRQPSLIRSYLAPSYCSQGAEHAAPLEVLAELLGGGETSRLYRRLVVERALAVAAGASYSPLMRDGSTLRVFASPREGVDLDTLEAALDAELERLLRDGVADDELARTRRRLLAELIYARDSLNTAAHALGSTLAVGLTPADLEAWPRRIAAVGTGDLAAAARAVLDRRRAVTGRLLTATA